VLSKKKGRILARTKDAPLKALLIHKKAASPSHMNSLAAQQQVVQFKGSSGGSVAIDSSKQGDVRPGTITRPGSRLRRAFSDGSGQRSRSCNDTINSHADRFWADFDGSKHQGFERAIALRQKAQRNSESMEQGQSMQSHDGFLGMID